MRARIESHANAIKTDTLLAKDGVIYKEAMVAVAEDVKKIMDEEVMRFYAQAGEHLNYMANLAWDAEEEEEVPPPAKRAKFGTREMPINPLAAFIDLCVEACP